jgi:hypothetical protein
LNEREKEKMTVKQDLEQVQRTIAQNEEKLNAIEDEIHGREKMASQCAKEVSRTQIRIEKANNAIEKSNRDIAKKREAAANAKGRAAGERTQKLSCAIERVDEAVNARDCAERELQEAQEHGDRELGGRTSEEVRELIAREERRLWKARKNFEEAKDDVKALKVRKNQGNKGEKKKKKRIFFFFFCSCLSQCWLTSSLSLSLSLR